MVALPESELRTHFSEMILNTAAPGKHCGRSALRHIERAYLISDINPEMAVFQAFTAEEEAATAVFHALERHGYVGAEKIKKRNHIHKMALFQLYEAIAERFNELQLHNVDPRIKIDTSSEKKIVYVAVDAEPLLGKPGWMIPCPPLNFSFTVDDKEYDFSGEVDVIASRKGAQKIRKHLERVSNQRNQALYAAPNGIPHVEKNLDGFLLAQHRKVIIHLGVFLMIDPYQQRQRFVQQALNAFLKVLSLLPRAI